jgi:hypothetical protein
MVMNNRAEKIVRKGKGGRLSRGWRWLNRQPKVK